MNKKSIFITLCIIILICVCLIFFLKDDKTKQRNIESVSYKDLNGIVKVVYPSYIYKIKQIEIYDENNNLLEIKEDKRLFYKTKNILNKASRVSYNSTAIFSEVNYRNGKLYNTNYNCFITYKLIIAEKLNSYDLKISTKKGLTSIYYANCEDLVSNANFFVCYKITVPTECVNINYKLIF